MNLPRRTRIRWQQIDADTPPWTEVRTPYDHQLATFYGLYQGRAQVRYPDDKPGVYDLLDPADVLEEIR